MGDTLTEELRRSSTANREEPVTVVKVRRVLKVGQEGVRGKETCMRREAGHVDVEEEAFLGRIESRSAGMGDRVERETAVMGVEGDLEVEVIKKEGRGKGGNEVGNKLQHEKSLSRNQVVKVAEDNLVEREKSEMTPWRNLETKVVESNWEGGDAIGLGREMESKDMKPDQGDSLKFSSQNLELEIDAKLKELKLISTAGGFEEGLEQDARLTAAPVEVEEMTSEDYYYDPLGHYAVHEEALKDDSRMQIWQQVS